VRSGDGGVQAARRGGLVQPAHADGSEDGKVRVGLPVGFAAQMTHVHGRGVRHHNY
jgi:hypothetical protein